MDSNLTLALSGPSLQHWFGCDVFGVDLGLKILLGAWRTLRIAFLTTALSMSLGASIGVFSATAPRIIDEVICRIIDCFMAFPGLLLAILVASLMAPSDYSLLFALTLTGWTSRARFCRAFVLKLKTEPFIEAARAYGASSWRIAYRHFLPILGGQLLVQAVLSFNSAVLAEASLSFLGLGGDLSVPSWGRLIAEGREYLVEAPHLSIFPGIAFLMTVIGLNLSAERLRNKLDPS